MINRFFGVGLDTSDKYTVVGWEPFLKLYSMFEVCSMPKEKIAPFWSRFFDLDCQGYCEEKEYLQLLEKLVRGKCMKTQSEFTLLFAINF